MIPEILFVTAVGAFLVFCNKLINNQGPNMRISNKKILADVNPEVRRRANVVLDNAATVFEPDHLSVGAFAGLRSLRDEKKSEDKGSSWLSIPLSSYHVWGLAVDFVFIRNGNWTWEPTGNFGEDRALWERLGTIIKAAGFEWGGDWKRFDGPHAQLPLINVASLKVRYQMPANYIRTWA